MITTILFDLDGTLLPMDRDVFTGIYAKGIGNHGCISSGFGKR